LQLPAVQNLPNSSVAEPVEKAVAIVEPVAKASESSRPEDTKPSAAMMDVAESERESCFVLIAFKMSHLTLINPVPKGMFVTKKMSERFPEPTVRLGSQGH
jgi:hypothetical protein